MQHLTKLNILIRNQETHSHKIFKLSQKIEKHLFAVQSFTIFPENKAF